MRLPGYSLVFRLGLRLTVAAAALPWASFATALQATSAVGPTTCVFGACPQTNASTISVGYGQVVTGPFDFFYNFANGDQFHVTGSYTDSYGDNGSQILFLPTATYVGNNGNDSAASAGTDTFSTILLQNFYDPSPGVWDGTYCETVPLGLAPNTSASGFVAYDGNALPSLPFTGPGFFSSSACSDLSFSDLENASPYLDTAYELSFTFDAGSAPGTTITSVPEPSIGPLSWGLAIVLIVLIGRKALEKTEFTPPTFPASARNTSIATSGKGMLNSLILSS